MPPSSARLRIQRFQVDSQLGSGAAGAVYRARDPQLGREVAIKVLARPDEQARRDLSPLDTIDLRDKAPAGELLAEAQMMARLSHPNVLPVYEVGLADGEIFVVMEYIAGSDLRTWLDRPRSTREIFDVFAQAAAGLAAAHAQGIVHRDFKPENVLVGDDGRVRVADFGLSRLSSRQESPLRVERTVGGTPYYMAPELWRGGAATASSDVFALCTALAEALGVEPAAHDQMDRALRGRGVDRRLRAAIAAGVAEDPQARPTVDCVIAALAAGRRAPRRMWWMAAAVLAVGGAGAAALMIIAGEEAACQADGIEFAGTWDAGRRSALAATGVDADFDEIRGQLTAARDAVCAAERRGALTEQQVRTRTSCLERRGFEVDALAARLAAHKPGRAAAREAIAVLPLASECERVAAPPLPADRAPVAALYRRLIEADFMPLASPERSAELAAVEREARTLGERELEARAAVLLGMRQIETDQLTAADASFARGYELAMAIGAIGPAVDALVERGIAAEKRGNPTVAHTYSQLAVELADKQNASPGVRIYVYYALARSELARGEPGRAIDRLDKALELLEGAPDLLREMDVRLAKISALLQLGGREQEALALARENLEFARTAIGERDSSYGIALNVVALALRHVGDRSGALEYRRRALDVLAASLPVGHSAVLNQRMNIASDLYANGRFEEARAEAAELVGRDDNESRRESRPMDIADLGAFTFATGRFDEGMRLFEQGLDALVSQVGQDHPDALDYRLQRVDFELELGKLDDAERHMDALEESYRARTDQSRALARLDGLYRARLALDRGDPAEAERRVRAALAAWRELRGDEEDRELLLLLLGESLADQGRWQQALEQLAAAETIARARREREDRFAMIDIQKARALAGLGRRAEAVALAEKARDVLRRFPGQLRARADAGAFVRARP